MTKFLKVFIVILIAIMFSACGGNLTSQEVKGFSGETKEVVINLSGFLPNSTIGKVSGSYVSRVTADMKNISTGKMSVYSDTYEEIDIPTSSNIFKVKLPYGEEVEIKISFLDRYGRELFYGKKIYSGYNEEMEINILHNNLVSTNILIDIEDWLDDLSTNVDIYLEDGTIVDGYVKSDGTFLRLFVTENTSDGEVMIDNFWDLTNLPVKLIAESGEINLNSDVSTFGLTDETFISGSTRETEIYLVDPIIGLFLDSVEYYEDMNISFYTNKVYSLSVIGGGENITLKINGSIFENSETIILEEGYQEINISGVDVKYTVQIFSEEDNSLLEEVK